MKVLCKRPINTKVGLVPCGQCMLCRCRKTMEWGNRMMEEASLHENNVFITLTYSDENLPANGSLERTEFTKFVKRLRKQVEPQRIKYYGCGEYGDEKGRPHYHLIVFNLGFEDFEEFYVGRKQYFKTESWKLGNIDVGTVTANSCRYVADYIGKPNGKLAEKLYPGKEKPFVRMSQGIGLGYLLKNKEYFLQHGSNRYYKSKLNIEELDFTLEMYEDFKKQEVDLEIVDKNDKIFDLEGELKRLKTYREEVEQQEKNIMSRRRLKEPTL